MLHSYHATPALPIIKLVFRVLALLLSCGPVRSLDGPIQRCQGPYQWDAQRDDQHYNIQSTIERDCLDTCTTGMAYNVDLERRAEKVSNLRHDFYTTMNSQGEQVTCLNITFEINRSSASKTKGLLFKFTSLRDLNGQCFKLNITTRLDTLSTFDPSNQPSENRRFHFDCFCDLVPGREYSLFIRPLPFHVVNCLVTDDQELNTSVKVPACRDSSRTWTDKYCTVEERWKPAFPIEFRQIFPEVNIVQVTFDIAPLHFAINGYTLYVDVFNSTDEFSKKLNKENMKIFPQILSGKAANFTTVEFELPPDLIILGKRLDLVIVPDIDHVRFDRPITGPKVKLKGNPCSEAGICGPLGTCNVSSDGHHVCQCREGSIHGLDDRCIANPCVPNPCGPTDVCEVRNMTRAGAESSCICRNGSTPCPSAPSFVIERNIPSSIPWHAVIASVIICVVTIIIITIIVLLRRYYCHGRHTIAEMPNDLDPEVYSDFHSTTEGGLDGVKPRILFAYEENCKDFVKLVKKLGLLLEKHGDVTPVLPSHHTLDIGKRGAEHWLSHTLTNVSKVLWLCSVTTPHCLEENSGDCRTAHQATAPYGNMFMKLVYLTEKERERWQSKHTVCYFSCASNSDDIPCILKRHMRYDLPGSIDAMCCYLLGVEMDDNHNPPGGIHRSVERTAFETALRKWHENIRTFKTDDEHPQASFRQPLLTPHGHGNSPESPTFVAVPTRFGDKMSAAWEGLAMLGEEEMSNGSGEDEERNIDHGEDEEMSIHHGEDRSNISHHTILPINAAPEARKSTPSLDSDAGYSTLPCDETNAFSDENIVCLL